MFLTGYPEYCFPDRILVYDAKGNLTHAPRAMRPDTPSDIVERMKELNEEWKKCHAGHPLYLFPGDEHYPTGLLNQ